MEAIKDDEEQLKFLIDFWVSKNQSTVETLGFITGAFGTQSYMLSNLDRESGTHFRNMLVKHGVVSRYNNDFTEMAFDLTKD